jgi:hypothetical protein
VLDPRFAPRPGARDPSTRPARFHAELTERARKPGFRAPRGPVLVVLLLALAVGGYAGYMGVFGGGGSGAGRAAAPGGAAGGEKTPPSASAGAAAPGQGRKDGPLPAAARSVAPARSPSAGSPPAGRGEPGPLTIESQPPGAQVYLDGALVGHTPIKIESTADRHKLAVIAPGYKPHIAEIDGRGKVLAALDEVTPPNGPAGIKIRCRQKNRYYVTLDGEPTGQLCPTERLGVELGEHTAEIYDPVTDSRRVYKVQVEDTRLSVRVRVD